MVIAKNESQPAKGFYLDELERCFMRSLWLT